MKDRIRELMEAQHMNQQTFSNYTGINSASLSSIFTGRTRPTLNTVEAILKKFPDVNLDWLMFGKGGMFKGASPTAEPSQNTQTEIQPATHNAEPQPAYNTQNYAPQQSANMAVTPSFFDQFQEAQGRHAVQQPREQKHVVTPQPTVAPTRRVTEIRVFYDDQTWESFIPKKS